MTDDLYRPHILDHYGNPRNWGHLERPDVIADADEPSCGDQVRIELAVDPDGRVADVAVSGEGCMVSMAAASILGEYIKHRSTAELRAMTEEDMLTLLDAPVGTSRRRCALLPLRVLQSALASFSKGRNREPRDGDG